MKKVTDEIRDIYEKFIECENDSNRKERYDGNEHFYHASAAGCCSRKIYYESIEQVKAPDRNNSTAKRLLRLGNVVHNDIQESLYLYNTNIYNTIYNKEKESKAITKKKKTTFHIEKEINLNQYNVRGFFDCVVENERVYLIDFKTIGAYGFKLKFGRSPVMDGAIHQEMQLGTYGLAVKEMFGRLDGMYLMYYCKDTSVMKDKQVPLTYLNKAEMFWKNVKREHEQGLPNFREGVSPVYDWECRYCKFVDHCKPPFRK